MSLQMIAFLSCNLCLPWVDISLWTLLVIMEDEHTAGGQFSKKEKKQKMDERDVVRGRRLKTVILDEQ